MAYYASSTPYTEAKILNSVGGAVSTLNSISRSVSGYLHLGGENNLLMARLAELEQQLAVYQRYEQDSLLRSSSFELGDQPYNYIPVKVLYNSINKLQNQIVLNRGIADGVRERMALISPDGYMLGYISSCSDKYSVATSILNTSFRSSGKLDGDSYVGSIYWSGDSRYQVQMKELSKYASPQVGQQIISTGFSNIFPAGVKIGRVLSYELSASQRSYDLVIELGVDISAIDNLFIVGSSSSGQIKQLLDGEEAEL